MCEGYDSGMGVDTQIKQDIIRHPFDKGNIISCNTFGVLLTWINHYHLKV